MVPEELKESDEDRALSKFLAFKGLTEMAFTISFLNACDFFSFKRFNPLSARAFVVFDPFLKKYRKFNSKLCNVIFQEWINQNSKFGIPFCRKFQALIRKCQKNS